MSRTATLLRALPAACAVAFLAACADGPTAPGAAPAARTVLPVDPPTTITYASFRVVDHLGNLAPGVTVGFAVNGAVGAPVTDNGAGDTDARPGHVRFPVGSGSAYTAWVNTTPRMYSVPPGWANLYTGSKFGAEVGFADLKVYARPAVRVLLRNRSLQPTPGATLSVQQLLGYPTGTLFLTDGQETTSWDGTVAPADGEVKVYVDGNTSFKTSHQLCETVAPAGYALANPACRTVDLAPGQQHAQLTFYHKGL
jgi:hypothetical protein